MIRTYVVFFTNLILCSAYNDMLYLCEKYAPPDTLERYNPEHDISVTKNYVPFVMKQLE